MFDRSQIVPKLEVMSADRQKVGIVDHLDGERIKLTRHDSADGQHHYIPLTWVDHVDAHVHLNVPATAVFTGWPGYYNAAGAGLVTEGKKGPNWLAWAALIAGLLALLLFGLKGCDRKPAEVTTTTTQTTTGAAPAAMAAGATTTSFNDQVRTFLGSSDAAPKTFAFDKVLFDTASATIKADEQSTVDDLAATLAKYPNVKIKLVGYTDARPVAGGNVQLGADRAAAVAKALEAKGIAADRIATATGGANDPAASNSTASGQAENRRTELVVTAK